MSHRIVIDISPLGNTFPEIRVTCTECGAAWAHPLSGGLRVNLEHNCGGGE